MTAHAPKKIPADLRPCAKCGATPRKPGTSYCLECYREYFRLRQRERRRDETLCCRCGRRLRAPGKSRCDYCLADERRRDAMRRARRADHAAAVAETAALAVAAREALAMLKAGKL